MFTLMEYYDNKIAQFDTVAILSCEAPKSIDLLNYYNRKKRELGTKKMQFGSNVF